MNPSMQESITVLVAPTGFQEGLAAGEVAEHLAAGVRRALPQARVLRLPLIDGSEGFVEALVAAGGGGVEKVVVGGPSGEPVEASLGWLGGPGPRTAVVEASAVASPPAVPIT